MKKFKIVSLLVLIILLGSCSKDTTEPDVRIDKTLNLKGTGDSANDILSNDTYDKLQIEIAYVSGLRPSATAISDFTKFLRLHTFKEDIEFIYQELESPNEENLTLQEIADLESENRTAYNNGSTLAVYIYFSDAPAEDDEPEEGLVTLGAVYRNTSMIIHEATIRRLAAQSILVSNADVEAATLNHEFGHLFGLVDLGTPALSDHEDTAAENHCNVDGCLMRAELQFTLSGKSILEPKNSTYAANLNPACVLSGTTVMSLLQPSKTGRSVEIPGLDAACIEDIQGNGAR
ncbi:MULTISPECIES: hypothetical protein [Maribacter]|uniref:Membrane metalloprotease n=1 Tax=Maribacter flavus TaxID=1658664 RepID=A0ABU7IH93_9FLAO|nr:MULTISPECIES: hypothetical protein [Maribacter]MDC6404910.1 hypothetical protein [Maribacter sp. PR66]MEE1972324.1 hypothetical protein [Maribacter flavus]